MVGISKVYGCMLHSFFLIRYSLFSSVTRRYIFIFYLSKQRIGLNICMLQKYLSTIQYLSLFVYLSYDENWRNKIETFFMNYHLILRSASTAYQFQYKSSSRGPLMYPPCMFPQNKKYITKLFTRYVFLFLVSLNFLLCSFSTKIR